MPLHYRDYVDHPTNTDRLGNVSTQHAVNMFTTPPTLNTDTCHNEVEEGNVLSITEWLRAVEVPDKREQKQ